MGIRLRTVPRFQVFDNRGVPLVGGKVYTYQPGTSTPKATYTDYTGNTANANPVILDARGEATIYWDGQYKLVVTDANDVQVWTEDNYGEGEESIITGNFNLVKNGSFENDTDGDGVPDEWTVVEHGPDGTVELDTTTQRHGQKSLKFVSLGNGGGYATSAFFEVQQALQYAVNFAHISSVADIHNQVDVVWYTAAQAVISSTTVYDEAAANPTSWTYYSYSATAPTNARFARLRLYGAKDDSSTVGTAWFDNAGILEAGNASGQIPINNGTVCTNLNADKVDGFDASGANTPSTIPVRDPAGNIAGVAGLSQQNAFTQINTFQQTIRVTGIQTVVNPGTTFHNFAIGTNVYFLRLSLGGAPSTITGFSNGVNGFEFVLVNFSGSASIVLEHDSASSDAGNRIMCPGSANYTVRANGGVMLRYDNTSGAWRVIAA